MSDRWNRSPHRARMLHSLAASPLATFSAQRDPFLGTGDLLRAFFSERTVSPPSAPALRVQEDASAYSFEAELPGLSETEVELTLEGRTVTIQGKREVAPPPGYAVRKQERSAFHVFRRFQLPVSVETDSVSARLKDGVLHVHAPKVAPSKPRSIPLNAS